jgi:hypothetical protein
MGVEQQRDLALRWKHLVLLDVGEGLLGFKGRAQLTGLIHFTQGKVLGFRSHRGPS